MCEYLLLREKRKQQEVQIKVEEVSFEDYQITEHYATKAVDRDDCFFCHKSDPFEFNKLSMPIRNSTCPSCGRFSDGISLLKCPLCYQKCTSVLSFRNHYTRDHFRNITENLKCAICKIFFFNEKARNVHGQQAHCIDCRSKYMQDKSLIIPFEDHESQCKNRTVAEVEAVTDRRSGGITVKKVKIRKTPFHVKVLSNREERETQLVRQLMRVDEGNCTQCHNKLGVQEAPKKG